jgi:HSP20 family protein
MPKDLERLRSTILLLEPASVAEAGWQPAADIYRLPSGWLVKFDLAGIRPDEVELTVRGCRLTVRGVRRDWTITECRHAYSMEIAYNRFQRTIELPCEAERTRVSTEYRDGMLLVRLLEDEELPR